MEQFHYDLAGENTNTYFLLLMTQFANLGATV